MEHTHHNHPHDHEPMEFESTQEALRFLSYAVTHNASHYAELESAAEYLDEQGFEQAHLLLHEAADCMDRSSHLIEEAMSCINDPKTKEE